MNQSLTLVKGTSGTGKGCRVSQLMSFLVMKGYEFEEIRHDFPNPSGTKMRNNIFGYYFKQLNILFAGRWIKPQKATGLFSWYSLDSLHSDIGGKGTNAWMATHNDKHVVAPLFRSTPIHALLITIRRLVEPILPRKIEIEAH